MFDIGDVLADLWKSIYISHRNIGWKAHSPSYGHHKKAVIFLLMEFAEVRSMASSAGCAENMVISYRLNVSWDIYMWVSINGDTQ